jgi:DNA-binding transcriptional LysR family regulator
MAEDLADLSAFVAVAQAGGFRDGALATGSSASGLSQSIRSSLIAGFARC